MFAKVCVTLDEYEEFGVFGFYFQMCDNMWGNMEGEDREDDGILPSEIFQLKSLGTVTRFFGMALGVWKICN